MSSSSRYSELSGKLVITSSLLKIYNLKPMRRYMKEQTIVFGVYWAVWISITAQSINCTSYRKRRYECSSAVLKYILCLYSKIGLNFACGLWMVNQSQSCMSLLAREKMVGGLILKERVYIRSDAYHNDLNLQLVNHVNCAAAICRDCKLMR